MNTPDPVIVPGPPVPAAAPWWRSRVYQGVLTIVATVLMRHAASHFNIDLESVGISKQDVVQLLSGLTDSIVIVVAGWVLHARASKPMPTLTLTKNAAQQINQAAAVQQNQEPPP